MSITNYYLRLTLGLNDDYGIEIASDASFTNIIASSNDIGNTPYVFIVTSLDDGDLEVIAGADTNTTNLESGCSSLEFVSDANLDPAEYSVLLNPGSISFSLGEIYYSDIVASGPANPWTLTQCCIHPMTTIRTTEGPKCIKNIKSGDIVYNHKGEKIEILFNIEYKIPSSEFFKLKRGSIHKNVPQSDVFLTRGHTIIFENMIRNVEDLEISEKVRTAPTIVYNLCTKNEEFIDVQGVPVSSYSKAAWRNFSQIHYTIFEKK